MNYEELKVMYNACSKETKIKIVILHIITSMFKFPIELGIILMSAVYTAVIAMLTAIANLWFRAKHGDIYCEKVKECVNKAVNSNSYCKPFTEIVGLFK